MILYAAVSAWGQVHNTAAASHYSLAESWSEASNRGGNAFKEKKQVQVHGLSETTCGGEYQVGVGRCVPNVYIGGV